MFMVLALALASGRAGFTIVELLIGCAILCLLAGLLLPAINSTRESARRVDCTHRLQQIGLALHGYHDARRHCRRVGLWSQTGRPHLAGLFESSPSVNPAHWPVLSTRTGH